MKIKLSIMKLFYILLATFSGAVLPLQILVNATLGQKANGPLWATTLSFAVGTIVLIIYLAITRQPIPSLSQLNSVPLWAWTGGIIGAFYVATTIIIVRPLGTTLLMAFIVAGQMIAALILDHFGILQSTRAITLPHIIGTILLMIGVILILQK